MGGVCVGRYCRYVGIDSLNIETKHIRTRAPPTLTTGSTIFSFLTQQQQHQTIDSRLVDSLSHVLLPLRVAALALNYQRSTWKVVSLSFAPPQVHFFTIVNLVFAQDTAIRCMEDAEILEGMPLLLFHY